MLPMFVAEGTIWVGFGALLPILPIYFTQHGVDLPTLGIVVAAWPAARLLGEPLFGWIADRGPRKAMMVLGLVLAAVFAVAPLFVVGPAAFIVFRALAGLSTSIYDPAARGYLVDANPPERHGELFGLYGAAQMGGLMIGPAIGGIAAGLTGQPTVVFWVAGLMIVLSALLVATRVPNRAHVARAATADDEPTRRRTSRPGRRGSCNRLLIAAVALNVGSFFASGAYEVVWSLYLTHLGASVGPDRRHVLHVRRCRSSCCRRGSASSSIARAASSRSSWGWPGSASAACCTRSCPRSGSWPRWASSRARRSRWRRRRCSCWWRGPRRPGAARRRRASSAPRGPSARSSPRVAAGALAGVNLTYPFYATGIAALSSLAIGLLIGRRRLWDAMQPRLARPAPGQQAVPVPGDAAG